MNKLQVETRIAVYKLYWKDFEKWIYGQTVAVSDNGESLYYEHDVQRFIDESI